jgi:hypothetical protein
MMPSTWCVNDARASRQASQARALGANVRNKGCYMGLLQNPLPISAIETPPAGRREYDLPNAHLAWIE